MSPTNAASPPPGGSSTTFAATPERTAGSGCSASRALTSAGTDELAARERAEPSAMISSISPPTGPEAIPVAHVSTSCTGPSPSADTYGVHRLPVTLT